MLAQSGQCVSGSLGKPLPGRANAVEEPVALQGGADLGAADLQVGPGGVFAA